MGEHLQMLLVMLGTLFMAAAAVKYARIPGQIIYSRLWKAAGLLIALFLIGYVAYFYELFLGLRLVEETYIIALIFLLVAVFVLIVMHISEYTFREQMKLNERLKEYADNLEKRVEERTREIEKTKNYLRLLMDSIQEALVAIDMEFRVREMNKTFEELTGLSRGELIGKSCSQIPKGSINICAAHGSCLMEEVIATRAPVSFLGKVEDAEGRTRYFEVFAYPVFNSGGEVEQIIELYRDVTERVLAEEKLRRYAAQLEQSNRIKDLFLDILRHDILNPAGVARNFVELLEMDAHTEEERENIEAVKRSIDKLIQIVEDASLLAKLDASRGMELTTLNLAEVIKRAVDEAKPLLEEGGMKVELNFKEELPIRASKIIEHVFLNLLTNAAKYASNGGRVVIEVKEEGDSYLVAVKDFGPGIADEFKETIFERFTRKEKRGVMGTGLGLAIVKRIVELHSGKVWVEDNPEGGSIFYVRLPKGVDTNL
ncbi:ATP-binding protein [Candidatus Pyrohabitans sp.]